jgi:2,4-dienoyl-CoA reductase-like NADH-dependent reductase (Old Yellow Enzyme family)
MINTGIGWHEARVPTIVTSVPRAAFAWVTKKLKAEGLKIPLVTTNRINAPDVADRLLADGYADMVSMARPLLADAGFRQKSRGKPRRRDQHLHRLQPGLPGSRVQEQGRVLPGEPARGARNRAQDTSRFQRSASP